MRISVVNYSKRPDSEVQRVIRAVNRQLVEDFSPYWHRSAILRLEGPPKGKPDIESTSQMRGDGILYLQEKADDPTALGYHELNLRGVPYGFVHMDIAREVGQHWSVTLSHEALEMVMDPEANLLASGPHPSDSGRSVQHWYEVCDAVQEQTYEIDGVEVSNFVTPLYFTAHNEDGSRNEFLGASGRGRRNPLPSFGVAPGGYVGFLDPETGEHETFTADSRAARRLEARNRAGWARRGIRHTGETSPELVRRLVTGCVSGEPLPGPWFEGFAIDVAAKETKSASSRLRSALDEVLGNDWRAQWRILDRTPSERDESVFEFDVVPLRESARIRRSDAFELSHRLAKQRHLTLVEPSFIYLSPDLDELAEPNPRRRMSAAAERHLPQSCDPNWCRDAMNLGAAWDLVEQRGAGVLVGHPDTGFLSHPQVRDHSEGGPVRLDLGWDFEANDAIPLPEFGEDGPLPGGPNHGTATASVIVSPENDGGDPEFVVGVAPDAQLVPLRVANSVIHFSPNRLIEAIRHATEKGCRVISMSLGGPFPSTRLQREIRRATEKGVILIAAAGNHVPFRIVVYPAHYDEVIAVAASNAIDEPWSGSSRGQEVDITAPGESVYRALWGTTKGGKSLVPRSERSSGTSYATAHVAGICALWLSHHGHEKLFERYGASLHDVFRRILRSTARPGKNMKAEDFVGIVDARAVLTAALPQPGKKALAAKRRPAPRDALGHFRVLFPHYGEAVLRRALSNLLGHPKSLDSTLDLVGLELAIQLATDQRLLRDFDAQIRSMAKPGLQRRFSTTSREMPDLNRRFRALTISETLAKALEGGSRPKPKRKASDARSKRRAGPRKSSRN